LVAPRAEIDALVRFIILESENVDVTLGSDQSDIAVHLSISKLALNDVANIGDHSAKALWFSLLISLAEVGPVSGKRNIIFVNLPHIDTVIPVSSKRTLIDVL
jgi:hypothetical protein